MKKEKAIRIGGRMKAFPWQMSRETAGKAGKKLAILVWRVVR